MYRNDLADVQSIRKDQCRDNKVIVGPIRSCRYEACSEAKDYSQCGDDHHDGYDGDDLGSSGIAQRRICLSTKLLSKHLKCILIGYRARFERVLGCVIEESGGFA